MFRAKGTTLSWHIAWEKFLCVVGEQARVKATLNIFFLPFFGLFLSNIDVVWMLMLVEVTRQSYHATQEKVWNKEWRKVEKFAISDLKPITFNKVNSSVRGQSGRKNLSLSYFLALDFCRVSVSACFRTLLIQTYFKELLIICIGKISLHLSKKRFHWRI